MKKKFKSFELNIKEFMYPGCHCNMEEKVQSKVEGVLTANINPINNTMKVTYDFKKTSEEKVIQFMKKCGYTCSAEKPVKMYPGKMSHKGMNHEKMDHADHHDMMIKDFKTRFLIALIITVPVLILSPAIQGWFNFSVPDFGVNNLVLAVLASVIVAYGGLPFYKGARISLKSQVLDMNVLVSLAVISGYLYSLGATFLFVATDFFWEISTLVLFLLFGHWMEMRAVKGASGALKELVKLIPLKANLVKGKDIIEINTADIKVGNVLLIRPGEKVPIDGIVIEGGTSVNESMITGESKPVNKQKGDEVIGGTINQTGAIRIKVEKTGEETAIAQIIELVKAAQASKPKTQKLADKAAHYLTLTAIIVGTLTFAYWFGIANAGVVFALTLTITVLVIACPHALGLAIPTVTSISTTLAARNGILVKDMNAMEIAKNIDYFVFDKTGTLTKGTFEVSDIITLSDWNEKTLLGKAAAIETNSEHVIGKGVVAKAKENKLKQLKTRNFKAIPGKGAKAIINGKETYVGNKAFMTYLKIDVAGAEKEVGKLASQGKTVVYVSTKKQLKGIMALSDIIRPEAYEAIISLKELGVKTAMLTGDNVLTAQYVANELGLETYFAEVLPEDKANKIKQLQSEGRKVAMVGDGINDAPALTQADIGIAIGAGTDVAVESAEIVLVKSDPRDISRLVKLSKATMRKMNENLFWATSYNIIAIPLAAGVLQPYGVVLRPEYAALIMAASSIIVVTNALLLRNTKAVN